MSRLDASKKAKRGPGKPFKKGHPGGPGRPKRAKEARYLKLLTDQVTETQWVGIIDKALEQASEGDHKAREWLSKYLLPDPSERKDSPLADLRGLVDEDLDRLTDEELYASIDAVEQELADASQADG